MAKLQWRKKGWQLVADSRFEHDGVLLAYCILETVDGAFLSGEGLVPAPIRFGRKDVPLAKHIAETIEQCLSRRMETRHVTRFERPSRAGARGRVRGRA